MELLYIKDLKKPYKAHEANKEVLLSDTLKEEFNRLYKEIRDSGGLEKDKWAEDARRLKQDVCGEVRQSGNSKSIYVSDYVDFIYGASCMLIARHGVSQAEAGRILGLGKGKFSKLGIYPKRSHKAYVKFDMDVNRRKSLIPNRDDTDGIRIAEFINENVAAAYECYGFAGVSNDLDMFANISIGGSKAYFLTKPSKHAMRNMALEEAARLFSVCRSRFLFATANNFDNDTAMHKAGKIKDKIASLLKMEDGEGLLTKSSRLRRLIKEGGGYEKNISCSRGSFERVLDCYKSRGFINKSVVVGEYVDEETVYDQELWKDAELDFEIFKNTGEKTEDTKEWLEKSVREKEEELLGLLTYRLKGGQQPDMEAFSDWLGILRDYQNCELGHELLGDSESGEEENYKKIKAAAIFWILEVFADGKVSESRYAEAMEYLSTSRLLSYFDSLNKEAGEKSQLHLFEVL
ncbi:hypothetical protein AALA98_08745 [Lachnospiraceae bacterium 45-W7]